MTTLHVQGTVGEDGTLRLEFPCKLPPGPTEVVVVLNEARAATTPKRWEDFYGFAKDVWDGEDAQDYVNRLRDEWER